MALRESFSFFQWQSEAEVHTPGPAALTRQSAGHSSGGELGTASGAAASSRDVALHVKQQPACSGQITAFSRATGERITKVKNQDPKSKIRI